MSLAETLYDWLLQGATPACDRIAGAALARAEPEWAGRLIELLLARRNETGWAVLLEHYERLPEQAKAALPTDRELFNAGLTIAVKSADADGRLNALRALETVPDPRLVYIAADALRDPDHRVRSLAATVLCRAADALLSEGDQGQPGVSTGAAPTRPGGGHSDRQSIVRALDDALRTFQTHHRADVLQAALWLCNDLEPRLWPLLNAARSHASLLASERLASWNGPRLASFLLSALRQPAWRALAARVLGGWRKREELAALLSQSESLNDPEVRRRLTAIKEPQWFAEVGAQIDALPAHLRAFAPRWLEIATIQPEPKIEMLRSWLSNDDSAVRRGAVYALAGLAEPAAIDALAWFTTDNPALTAFCRWTIRARKMQLVRSRADEPPPDAAERDLDVDFSLLWQICRRTEATRRGELVDILRENIQAWRWRIRNCFRSPDPRDRILALQVVSTPELTLLFRQDLQELRGDPVEGIRRLAQSLAESSPEAGSGAGAHADTHHAASIPASAATASVRTTADYGEESRRRLRDRLEGLAAKPSQLDDPFTLRELRGLLRTVYGPAPAGEEAA